MLHGGEPLIAGARPIDKIVRMLKNGMPTDTDLLLAITTNGIGLVDGTIRGCSLSDERGTGPRDRAEVTVGG